MSFGEQVRRRRRILGYTQQDVVNGLAVHNVSITKAALSKYETGKSIARSDVFYALCKTLDCSADYLLEPKRRSIRWLRFRKSSSLGKRQEARIKETARQWLEARFFIEDIVGTPEPEYKLPSRKIRSVEDAEALAFEVRRQWGVGDWPIESISNAMERSGVYVVEVHSDDQLDGIAGLADDQVRFVVVSDAVPTDRMRMNLAHELAHTILEPTDDEKFDEALAFRFGASLLIPAEVVFDRIGRERTRVDLRELRFLKQEFGISIQALIRRCYDLGIVSDWTYRQLNIELRSRGWHRREPGECDHREHSTQLESHLLRCLVEGLVSESDVKSMFPEVAREIDTLTTDARWQWASLRDLDPDHRTEILEEAARKATDDYGPGGSLSGLELIDDE